MLKLRSLALLCLILLFPILKAQELLTVQQGQFFEQVYGGAHLESATDIIQTPSKRWIFGWTNYVEDESSNRQATLWFLDSINHNYQTNHYGSTTTDESGEALTQYGTDLIVAIRRSSVHPNEPVAIGDETIIKYLDEDGVVQWSYNHNYEEEGLKPNDIIIDGNNHIVVLCDGINSSSVRYTQLLKFDLSGNLINTYSKYYGASRSGAYSYELIQYNQSYYLTATNDVALDYPVTVLFDVSNPASYIDFPHSSLKNYYHFGLTKDLTTQKTHIAGYRVFEEDTNAIITILDSTLSIDNTVEYGDTGKQQLIDISQTAVGYMAVGITNHNGEGGDDCLVLHLDAPATISNAETLGSEFNDEVKHLSANLIDPKAFFSGMTLQYGAEYGNAYVGGILAFPGPPSQGVGCKIPRILMLDGLFDFSIQNNEGQVFPPLATNKLKTPNTILQEIKNYKADYVLLYGIDRLFIEEFRDQRDYSSRYSNGFNQDVNYIQDFLEEGQRQGIVFGVVVDPYVNSIDQVGEGLRFIHNRMNFVNGTHAGKVTFMMLEHEFWNLNDDIWPLNPAAFFNSPLMRNLLGNAYCNDAISKASGNPPASWTSSSYNYYNAILNISGYGISNLNKAHALNIIYHQMAKVDHQTLLNSLSSEVSTSANFHASCDYISYLFLNAGMPSYGFKNYYSNVNLQNQSLPTITTSEALFTSDLATTFKTKSDATFLTFYRNIAANTTNVPFDFNYSSDYTQRFDAYFSQNSDPFTTIPLLSAEHTTLTCMPGGSNAGYNYMGDWLGGSNTLESAEADYMDQFIQYYQYSSLHNSTCNNCGTLIQNIAFAWYQYDCIDAAESSNGSFSNTNNVSCYGNGTFNQKEINFSNVSFYPNPFEDKIIIEGLKEDHVYKASIRNIIGQEITNLTIKEGVINLDRKLIDGVYIILITENGRAFKNFKAVANAH